VTSKANTTLRKTLAGFIAAAAVLAFCAPGSAVAATTTVKGKGTYFVKRALMPLGDGGAVIHTTATTVASADVSVGGVLFGECAGLVHISGDGQAKSRVYCNFAESDDDVFVIEADMGLEGGAVRVIGGSGKWKGASGTGTLKRTGESDANGTYEYEFNIVTP
jgi:hypothetical protein